MSNVVIRVEDVSKQYRLGQISTGSLAHDVNRWWHTLRGKQDPYLKIGEENDRTVAGNSEYVWALKDISFDVKQGEVLGIIGRNGAGKSTLLKILSRTTLPTTGTVKAKGRIASLLEVGTGFHPELTGRENIFLNGAILGMTKREITSKFDEIVDFSGVEKYIDTPVKRYSSGMYVRLAFAVAAHLEPEILIVDEVLAVGDAEFQKKCLGKMKDVSVNEGRTVLFVSHNMLAIKSLCSKGMWFHQGGLQKLGIIEDVINAYLLKNNSSLTSLVNVEKEQSGFTVHSLEVSNNGINGNFNIEDDLIINIKVSSNKDFRTININLFFNTLEGITIFVTCSAVEEFKQGEYHFQCTIPENTLNDDIYKIDLMVVEDGPSVIHHLKDIISIEGVEHKRDGAWLEKFPGLIRPINYKWSKSKMHE